MFARALSRLGRANQVLALSSREIGYRYPAFRFETAVREQMPQLLDVFGRGRLAAAVTTFSVQAEPLLEPGFPLDLLRVRSGARHPAESPNSLRRLSTVPFDDG